MVNAQKHYFKAALYGLVVMLCVLFSSHVLACSMAIPPGKTAEQAQADLNQWIKSRCETGGGRWLGDQLTVQNGIVTPPVDAVRLTTCSDRYASEMNQPQFSSCYQMNCDCGEGSCFDGGDANGKCVNYTQWKAAKTRTQNESEKLRRQSK